MIIGACTVRLHLPGVRSLKEKRSRLRPLLARLPKEFSLAAAETGLQDVWQSAEISLVTVSNDDALAQSALETAVRWIERTAPDVEVADYKIELR